MLKLAFCISYPLFEEKVGEVGRGKGDVEHRGSLKSMFKNSENKFKFFFLNIITFVFQAVFRMQKQCTRLEKEEKGCDERALARDTFLWMMIR